MDQGNRHGTKRKGIHPGKKSTAIGPLAGGMIYDSFGSYAWLYVGAFGIGIGAFLMAMTLRPMGKGEPAAVAVS